MACSPIERPVRTIERARNPIEEPSSQIEIARSLIEEPRSPIEEPRRTIEIASSPIEILRSSVERPRSPVEIARNPIGRPGRAIEKAISQIETPELSIEIYGRIIIYENICILIFFILTWYNITPINLIVQLISNHMNFLDQTFWDMMKSCASVARLNELLWINNKKISLDIIAIEGYDRELTDATKKQTESDTSGHTTQKKQEMQQVASLCYRYNRALCHLAKQNGDNVLLKLINITESEFFAFGEKETFRMFRTVLDTARKNVKDLADYNITADSLAKLETMIVKVEAMPSTIVTVSDQRKSAKREITEIIADAREKLDQLDDAIEAIIEDAKFIESWFDNRKIKGRHVSPKKKNNKGGQNTTENKATE